MAEKKNERLDERIEKERIAQHRLVGWVLFPIAFFPLLSLLSYDWRDISWLTVPPLSPSANLIGVVGAWSAFLGYSLIGVAVWVVPVLALIFSVLLIYGKVMRVGRRVFWMLLFIAALCCLVQLGSGGIFADTLQKLNMKPNAGGAIGYWLMTCMFARWFSPFGGGILMVCIMVLSLSMAIGLTTVIKGFKNLWTGFWKLFPRASDVAAEEESGIENPEDLKAIKERNRLAREQAKAARKAEKEKARAEKARIKAEKKAATAEQRQIDRQERLRQRQEAARQAQIDQQHENDEMARERELASRARLAAARSNQRYLAQPQDTSSVKPLDPLLPISSSFIHEQKQKEEQPSAAARAEAASEREPPHMKKSASVPEKKSASVETAEDDGEDAAKIYVLPPLSLLDDVSAGQVDSGDVEEVSAILVQTLANFNVAAEIVNVTIGPVVTQYELRPAPNVRVERIKALTGNIQMALEAKSLRVLAPIPGKNAVGIEIPNKKAIPVTFGEVIRGKAFQNNKCQIPLLLGKDIAGKDLIYDLAKGPHLLVAGSTGSGKSVCLNSIIIGLLMSRTPEQVRLILVDPKRVEFAMYNNLPHLLVPVINEPNKVAFGLRWAIQEMEKRYKLLQKHKCRNIIAYNSRKKDFEQPDLFARPDAGEESEEPQERDPDTLPYIVVAVDEVADIMASVGKEVEPSIARLTALSRAVGIHLILATQRPSVDVITGTIKSNIPGRIAFKVSQANDSRTILDNPGAEELIGKGDMLFLKEGSQLIRAQGAWLSDEEIANVVDYVKQNYKSCYDAALAEKLEKVQDGSEEDILDDSEEEKPTAEDRAAIAAAEREERDDELVYQAIDLIRRTKRVSTTMLQRRLGIGYTRASRIMDTMEGRGIVSPPKDKMGGRDILADLDALMQEYQKENGGFDEKAAMDMNEVSAEEAPGEAFVDSDGDEIESGESDGIR